MKSFLPGLFLGLLIGSGIGGVVSYNFFNDRLETAKTTITNYKNTAKTQVIVQKEVSTEIEKVYIPKIEKVKELETIYVEIPVATDPDHHLTNGWVLKHDGFVQDRTADATGFSDGAPSEFGDNQVLDQILANYAVCKADQLKLAGLQEWILKYNAALVQSESR